MSQARPPTPPFGRTVKLQQGYEMHYLEHGSGPPVVFVHGSGPGVNAHSNFFPNYKVLAAAGYRAVLPDMLGFGWSSKPTGIDYTLELFVATLREFLDQLEIQRCVLVGNSLGGAISMKLAIDSPERVEKLIVMGPGGIESRETYFKMPGIQRMVSQFVGSGFDRAGLKELLALLAYDAKIVTDALVEERFNVLQTQPKEVLSRMVIPDLTPQLGKLRWSAARFLGRRGSVLPGERL